MLLSCIDVISSFSNACIGSIGSRIMTKVHLLHTVSNLKYIVVFGPSSSEIILVAAFEKPRVQSTKHNSDVLCFS